MEVLKVRLQGQKSSNKEAGEVPKYRNAAHAAYIIAKDEGPQALFKGMSLTALRQGTNVSGKMTFFTWNMDNYLTRPAVNMTTYTKLKQNLHAWQPIYEGQDLPSIQTALCGLIAGAAGPMSNAPIDTLSTSTFFVLSPLPSPQRPSDLINCCIQTPAETLVQRNPTPPGHSSLSHTVAIARTLFEKEGFKALYKGITPRIMRVAPGQAITYTIYEHLRARLSD